ncbi:MAG TPA: hypothetical protein ENI87_06080 [bacterium]|nr:hypothetical protein [bacterium]
MRYARLLLLPLFLGLTIASASAQNVIYQSLANAAWERQGGPWTPVAEPESEFGQVLRLNFLGIPVPELLSAPRWLEAGTYTARMRFKKRTSAAGAVPITLRAILSPISSTTAVTQVAQQAIGGWTLSEPVTFTLNSMRAVRFRVEMVSGGQDYDFDSFVLDRVTGGPVVDMLDLAAGSQVHPQFYTVEDSDASHFGDKLVLTAPNQFTLSWLQVFSPSMTLPAGDYYATVRLRKTVDTVGITPLTISARTSGAYLNSVTMPTSAQPVGTWVDSPPVAFTLTQPTSVFFQVHETSQLNWHYEFLTVTVYQDVPSYEVFGAGCNGVALSGTLPRIGQPFTLTVTGAPANAPVVFGLGYSQFEYANLVLPFDLYPLGALGCVIFAAPQVTLVALASPGGIAQSGFAIPNDSSFLGWSFLNQAFLPDPTANLLGLSVSNAGIGRVGN